MLLKLQHHFKKHIKPATQRVRAFLSKLRKYFREHPDEILTKIVFLLGALGVVVMVSDDTAIYLQQLLGLSEEPSEKLSKKYDVLKTIGFCIVGVLLVLQALAANKRAKAMEDATENTEEGQRQERLKNAIEHLGHKSDSVRMGGAYELFHLAKDTSDLRQTVMDILCAHIRQTTGDDTYKEKHEAEPSGEKHKAEPSEEIQSLLTLLFVQEHDVFEDCHINLQGSYLKGATLSQARLKKANLVEAQLQEVDLREAQLQEADLSKAQLQEASLMSAQLQRVIFIGAKLEGAKLWGAQMNGDFLIEAQSQGANLSMKQMEEAYFIEAQLQEDDRREAELQAQLQESDLSNNAPSAPDSDKDKGD